MSKVRIIYRSGADITVECENLTVKKNGLGEVTQLEWTDDIKPRPLFAGVNEIAAIWVLK